jgi:hypothetical protein
MTAFTILLLAIVPVELTVRDDVDLAELNHFYDDEGRHVFDQVIYYDWSDPHERFQVRAWRIVKCPAQLPQHDWATGRWLAIWQDSEVLRRVTAASFRETWTQYDPELLEREFLPRDRRRELTAPPPL